MATPLILKRANASRPSGHWSEDDYDVLAEGEVVGPHHEGDRRAGEHAVDVDARLRASPRTLADARLRADARGGHDDVCEDLAAILTKARQRRSGERSGTTRQG
jgi:hypothetical protein